MSMKITWLGQAGLLFESNDIRIMIDPYLSNSVEAIQPHFWRRVPVDESFFEITPDVIILTHDHLDHTDPDTLKHFLGENTKVCVLASENAWDKVRKEFGGIKNNYVQFNRGTEWTEKGVQFRAIYAEHSDSHAIGVVIVNSDGTTYYVTGDTLYNKRIFDDLPDHIDYIFLPVNGVGNNMNMADAKRFCEQLGATAIPLHCGLFDELDFNDFKYENKIIPDFFKEINLK